MSQHLEDRLLTDLAFNLLDAKEAAAAKRHLQGCKACKARQKTLRATIGQLDATRADFKASEDLIARTLRATRGEKSPVQAAPESIRQSSVADPVPDNILDLPPRKSVLELQRFFWLAAAAAILVAGLVTYSTMVTQKKSAVASATPQTANGLEAPVKLEVNRLEAHAEAQPESSFDSVGERRKALAEKRAAPIPQKVASVQPAEDKDAGTITRQRRSVEPGGFVDAIATADTSAPAGGAARPPPSVMQPTPPPAAAAPPRALATTRAKSEPSVLRAAPPAAAKDAAKPEGAVPMVTSARIAPAEGPVAFSAPGPATPAAASRHKLADDIEFTVQTISFMLPTTSGTWVLQQNVRVRASVTDNEARLDVANHGVLPVVFNLMPRRGTNVLQQVELDAGATTNLIQRTR